MAADKVIPVFELCSRVTVGNITFPFITSFKIEESVVDIGNTAHIELPRNYGRVKGKSILDYLKVGDAVTIEAGYNGDYAVEFTGFLRKVNAEMPLQLECDDEWWPLKQNNEAKSYTSITLKALLQEIMPGYTVDAPELNLGKFERTGSCYDVMRKIQQEYGLFSRINGKKIVFGYSYDFQPSGMPLIYHRQKNVKASKLEWKRKEDFNIKVRVEWLDAKRHKKHVEVGFVRRPGDTGTLIRRKYTGTSESDAKNIGNSILNVFAYDGYTGSFTGFAYPRTHAGDSIQLYDRINPEKNGKYLLSRVTITYNESTKYSRENTVSHKLPD